MQNSTTATTYGGFYATYAIVLRKKINATYKMHKIQRMHATQGTTSQPGH